MRNLKRVFCLFLVFAMLVPYAYAVADPIGGGVGNAQAGSGGSDPNSPFATNTNEDVYGAGLMISVETPSGITLGYEDDPSNPDNPRKISDEDKKAFYEYYTSHFPQTDPDHNEYGMYLIPTNYYDRHDQRSQSYIRGAPGNRNDVKGFDLGEQQLRMQSPSDSVNNVGGKAAWNAAYQNMQSNPARPNPYLEDGYWITYIKNLSRDEAEKRISQIFSSSNPSVGYNASNDADDLPTRVYNYLGFSGGINEFLELADSPYKDTALFMNYCSFLLEECTTRSTARDLCVRTASHWRLMCRMSSRLLRTSMWNSLCFRRRVCVRVLGLENSMLPVGNLAVTKASLTSRRSDLVHSRPSRV